MRVKAPIRSALPSPHRLQLKLAKLWREDGRPLLLIALVVFAFRSAIADWNDVPTGSMKPTMLEGDRVFVNKLAYDLKIPFTRVRLARWADPRRGDIVVCDSPEDGKRLVKRVVGIPGDRLELRQNHLYVKGEPAHYRPLAAEIVEQIDPSERLRHDFAEEEVFGQSHAVMGTPAFPAPRSFQAITVPAGQYFMMGDNRDVCKDSRYFGFVSRRDVLGQATAVVLSVDPKAYYLPRTDRFFRSLQ